MSDDWPPEKFVSRSTHFPGSMKARKQWTGLVLSDRKLGFAPWAEKDHPDADADEDARWKWGLDQNLAAFETVKMVQGDERVDGFAWVQFKDDPFIYVDFDDVRDPETGEVHPAVVAFLAQLNPTYVDISPSGTGIHAIYRGELPAGTTEATWKLDDEPWGENGDAPGIEIYSHKRLLSMTGDHVAGTPKGVRPINEEVLDPILEAVDQHPDQSSRSGDPAIPAARSNFDSDDYDPDTTESDERAGDVRDIFSALNRLDCREVAEKTIVHRWNDDASTSEGARAFYPTWGPNSNGTANVVHPDKGWKDTGDNPGEGGPCVMALIDMGEIRHSKARRDSASGKLFFDAVEHLRDLGFNIPKPPRPERFGGDGGEEMEPEGIIPIAALDYFSHEERRRFARKRGITWPDVDGVRERLDATIREKMRDGETVVLASPTGSGKTYNVATENWLSKEDVTGGKPVVHSHATTTARDQAGGESDAAGVDAFILRGRDELCPVAAGEYDPDNDQGNPPIMVGNMGASEWINHICNERGIPFSTAHVWLEEEVGSLPCCEDDSACPATTQFDNVPRDDNGNPTHDVIHCTHQFMMVPSLRLHTNVVLDEKPTYEEDVGGAMFRESVNQYLAWADAPVDNLTDLLVAAEHRCEPEYIGARSVDGVMLAEYKKGFEERMDEALNAEPDMDWYRDRHNVHALAPALARAVWNVEEAACGERYRARVPYNPPRLDDSHNDSDAWNRVMVDVVLDSQKELETVELVPDFSDARSVIGLDAHASHGDPRWEADVSGTIPTEHVLDVTERALYRRYERGLFTVQVGEGVQPMTSDKYLDEGQGHKMGALVKQLARDREDWSTAITSAAGESRLLEMMKDAGIENPETMHYGEEESRNDFAGEEVGFVAGCIDQGDDEILNLLARLGYDAKPVYNPCPKCDGDSSCETCGGEGEVREHGRTFEGPDAEKAEAALAGVREHHVAQSVGRWARNAEDPDDHATVYIMTEATPPGFIDAKAPGVIWSANEGQRERIRYVTQQATGATAREVAEATDCSKSAALRTLRKAAEHDLLLQRPGAGKHGATVYTPVPETTPEGAVSVQPSESHPHHRGSGIGDNYTWSAAVSVSLGVNVGGPPDAGGGDVGEVPLEAFLTDPPPD